MLWTDTVLYRLPKLEISHENFESILSARICLHDRDHGWVLLFGKSKESRSSCTGQVDLGIK